MKLEVSKVYGTFKIIAEHASENEEVGRIYKELEEIFANGKYKLVQIKGTCRDDRTYSLNSLEFVAKDENGKQRVDFFSHAGRIMR